MALPAGIANWHWRSKDVTKWAKDWLRSQCNDAVIFSEGSTNAKIGTLKSCDGDAEIGMRKSNLTSGSGSAANALHQRVRKELPKFFKDKLGPFPRAMLDTHGRDVTPSVSGTATPVGNGPAVAPAEAAARLAPLKAKAPAKAINTSTVTVEATLAASAEDIYELLTNESRIPSWSRAPAKSNPVPDSEYSIFGGNIYGKYVQLDKPSKIVQTWHVQGFQSIGYVRLENDSFRPLPPAQDTTQLAKPPPSLSTYFIVASVVVSLAAATFGARYLQ
ncbi:hypothetical protein FS837_009502 [Tulasnella sp. UAMH 9824]|nr:hypothetical protein FS837_009502 [Tulasnella sp. UAMH 9824]